MRVQLAPQAQELLGQSDLVIIPERVDDGASSSGSWSRGASSRCSTGICPDTGSHGESVGAGRR